MPLILETIVQAEAFIGSKLAASKEAIGSDSIVEVDDDHAIVSGINEISSVVICVTIDVEATALDEDVDRQVALISGRCGCKYVDEEAVFRMRLSKFGFQ